MMNKPIPYYKPTRIQADFQDFFEIFVQLVDSH